MSKIFFIADTHFGHANVIQHCQRPFATVAEMDAAMVACWNSVVRPGDVVWHLGDFAYKSADQEVIFKRLNGTKNLLTGNHDDQATRRLGWASVDQIKEIGVDGQRLVLSHYPMLEWPGARRGAVHLFGHCHGRREGMPESLDIGVDVMGFTPVQLPQILEKIAERQLENAPSPERRR